jgi:hypothetical protein
MNNLNSIMNALILNKWKLKCFLLLFKNITKKTDYRKLLKKKFKKTLKKINKNLFFYIKKKNQKIQFDSIQFNPFIQKKK